jgi:hypothetical protein
VLIGRLWKIWRWIGLELGRFGLIDFFEEGLDDLEDLEDF